MGLGRVEPQNEGETLLHDGDRPQAFTEGERGQLAARQGEPPDVGPPLAVAGRGRGAHRPHHQRRARPQLARPADATVVRQGHGPRLGGADGRLRALAEDLPGRARPSSGRPTTPQEPDDRVCPPPREPAVPPPRRGRGRRRGGPPGARPRGADDRASPAGSPRTSGPTCFCGRSTSLPR